MLSNFDLGQKLAWLSSRKKNKEINKAQFSDNRSMMVKQLASQGATLIAVHVVLKANKKKVNNIYTMHTTELPNELGFAEL